MVFKIRFEPNFFGPVSGSYYFCETCSKRDWFFESVSKLDCIWKSVRNRGPIFKNRFRNELLKSVLKGILFETDWTCFLKPILTQIGYFKIGSKQGFLKKNWTGFLKTKTGFRNFKNWLSTTLFYFLKIRLIFKTGSKSNRQKFQILNWFCKNNLINFKTG